MSRITMSDMRTTSLLSSNRLLAALRQSQRELVRLQQQISTGRALERPSDQPARTSAVLLLDSQIAARGQHERNLQHALGVLNNVDSALGDSTNILLEARGIAYSTVGITSNADTRASEATVIDAQLRSLLDIANRQYQNISLFGGNRTTAVNQPVFVEFMGGIRYLGSRANLAGDVGHGRRIDFNSNGDEAFGALSKRVESRLDLNPQATADTRLLDINGATGQGVRLGAVHVTVDGATVAVDLTGAGTLGDVLTRINHAIQSVDPSAGQLALDGAGFALSANAGHQLEISEQGSGKTASDLGLAILAPGGAAIAGADLDPRLTALTELSALGTSVDFSGGLKITQGAVTRLADFSGARTVEDLINIVDQLGLGVRLEINPSGTSLNLINEVSGLEMSIGENAGGTTAGDLGLRTLGLETMLADLRHGLGVESVLGEDDFAVELHDGTQFHVNLDGLSTVGQVIEAIRAAAMDAGLSVGSPGQGGTFFNVGLALDGNGLALEDQTSGTGDFRVVQLGTSLAATHLGIYSNAQDGNAIVGEDVAKVKVNSVFTHLMDLRDSLRQDHTLGITLAGEALEHDLESLARIRADVGGRAQRVEQSQERSQQLMIAEKELLSQMRDTDLTEAISRFLQLQQQLQASMQIGSMGSQMSLLDFLR